MRQPMRRQTLMYADDTQHVIEVGRPHPFLTPPPSGGQAMGVEKGYLACDAFLTPPLDKEVQHLNGLCIAYGIHATKELVIPIFLFQAVGGRGMYPLHAPIDSTAEAKAHWLASDTNAAWFYLMEAGTGVVRGVRNLGLDAGYLAWLKAAVEYVNRPADLGLYQRLLDGTGEEQLWARARKWLYLEDEGRFAEIDDGRS